MEKDKTVLFIDDDSDLLNSFRQLLSEYKVLTAHSGKMALEVLQHETVDVIVTDVNMPEMSGYEFIRSLKRGKFHLPVILISGDDEMGMVLNGCELGAISCLAKPFRATDLRNEIRFALRGNNTLAA